MLYRNPVVGGEKQIRQAALATSGAADRGQVPRAGQLVHIHRSLRSPERHHQVKQVVHSQNVAGGGQLVNTLLHPNEQRH